MTVIKHCSTGLLKLMGNTTKQTKVSYAKELIYISFYSPGVASCVTLMEYSVAAKPEP